MNTLSSLPPSPHLPVKYLSASFNNITNSYKFYWFLSILEHIKENQSTTIPINNLIARMIAGVWYPSNYFKLSFGKQDRLSQIALAIKTDSNLSPDASKSEILNVISTYLTGNSLLSKEINSLAEYVPYRFLRPFFSVELRSVADWKVNNIIQQLANRTFIDPYEPCLYQYVFSKELNIEIHPVWFTYLQMNLPIMMGFCLWHLLNYLQKNNPNVPNIANKLFEPEQRNLRFSRKFWQIAFDTMGKIRCIYSGESMQKVAFSLDHFLPWSFVAHDLMWNIIPTSRNVNSAKNDQLPNLHLYFEPFVRLQYDAFQAIASPKQESLLEDYVLLFKKQSVIEVQALPFDDFKRILYDAIAPQFQIARNMGFTGNWSYLSI